MLPLDRLDAEFVGYDAGDSGDDDAYYDSRVTRRQKTHQESLGSVVINKANQVSLGSLVIDKTNQVSLGSLGIDKTNQMSLGSLGVDKTSK